MHGSFESRLKPHVDERLSAIKKTILYEMELAQSALLSKVDNGSIFVFQQSILLSSYII